jgi:hypothetical protein
VNVGRRTSRALFVVSLTAAGLFAGHAAADKKPTPAELQAAAEEFDAGVKAVKRQDFDAAAARFEGADREVPSPGAIQASIRARKDAKQMDRAATLAEQALLRYPEDASLAAFAKGILETAAPELQRVEVSCAPACVLAVDSKLLHGGAATTIVLYTTPGKHSLSASWNKKQSVTQDLVGVAGATKSLKLAEPSEAPPVASTATPASSARPTGSAAPLASSESADPPPPPEPPPSGGLPKAVFISGAVITGVLAGVTVWSGVDAQNNPGVDKVKRACVGRGEGCKLYQQGLSSQRRTNALLAGTLAAGAVTGVIAIFTNWKGQSSEPTTAKAGRIVPNAALGPSGGWVEATIAF